MSSILKLIEKIQNQPTNANYNDIKKILEYFGYELKSVRGSHHKFAKGNETIIIPYHKPIKEIYVTKILNRIKGDKQWKKI